MIWYMVVPCQPFVRGQGFSLPDPYWCWEQEEKRNGCKRGGKGALLSKDSRGTILTSIMVLCFLLHSWSSSSVFWPPRLGGRRNKLHQCARLACKAHRQQNASYARVYFSRASNREGQQKTVSFFSLVPFLCLQFTRWEAVIMAPQ